MQDLIAIAIFLDLVSTLIKGFVFKLLWGWFAVPYLDMPELPWLVCVGLILIVELLRSYTPQNTSEPVTNLMGLLFHEIYSTFFPLVVGAVIHFLIL